MGDSKYISVGNRIKKFREELGWSKQQLADNTGLYHNQICDYESDRRLPSIFSLECLCKAMNKSATELLGF